MKMNKYIVSIEEYCCPTCGKIMNIKEINYNQDDGLNLVFKCENDDCNTYVYIN